MAEHDPRPDRLADATTPRESLRRHDPSEVPRHFRPSTISEHEAERLVREVRRDREARHDPVPDRLAEAPVARPVALRDATEDRSCWTCRHDYIADGIGGHGCRALTCDEAADAPIVTYCDASGALNSLDGMPTDRSLACPSWAAEVEAEARALAAMHAAIADDEREQGWRGLLEEDVTGAPYSDVRPWLR